MNNENTATATAVEVQETKNITELISTIPQELKLLSQWVNWRYEQRNGKSTKVPTNARNGNNASCDDLSTWSDFQLALQTLQAGNAAGVGFQITPPYVGIDLDKCRNIETGQIEQWAQDIISEVNSYTELSPSQTGVHIWTKGELPPGGRHKGRVEMYDGKRFFTMTGARVANTPATIEKRTAQLKALHERIFASNPQELNAAPTGCKTSHPSPNRPIGRVLALLKNVQNGSDSVKWSARCPSHGDEHNSLSVAEDVNGKVLLKCHAGCDLQKIVGAVSLTVSDLFPAFSLAEYAHAKKLTLDSLTGWGLTDSKAGRIEIPYFDEEHKNVLATRYRCSLTGPDRFRWKKNDQPCPYGLWTLANARELGFVVVVEGESDCHTLWQHDIPALGLPGAAAWRNEWADFLKDIPKIYAVVEPDQGGEALQKSLLQSSANGRSRTTDLTSAIEFFEKDRGISLEGLGNGKGLSARNLAELLRPYEIRPQNVRAEKGKVNKAYKKDSFKDSWERYLLPIQAPGVKPQMVENAEHLDDQDALIAVTEATMADKAGSLEATESITQTVWRDQF